MATEEEVECGDMRRKEVELWVINGKRVEKREAAREREKEVSLKKINTGKVGDTKRGAVSQKRPPKTADMRQKERQIEAAMEVDERDNKAIAGGKIEEKDKLC